MYIYFQANTYSVKVFETKLAALETEYGKISKELKHNSTTGLEKNELTKYIEEIRKFLDKPGPRNIGEDTIKERGVLIGLCNQMEIEIKFKVCLTCN